MVVRRNGLLQTVARSLVEALHNHAYALAVGRTRMGRKEAACSFERLVRPICMSERLYGDKLPFFDETPGRVAQCVLPRKRKRLLG